MLNRLNSIWKNLLIDLLGGAVLFGLTIYNLYKIAGSPHLDFLVSEKIALGLSILLFFHGLFLIFLFIKNLIDKHYLKAFTFLVITTILYTGLWLFYVAFLVFSIGAHSLDDHGKLGQVNDVRIYKQTERTKNYADFKDLTL